MIAMGVLLFGDTPIKLRIVAEQVLRASSARNIHGACSEGDNVTLNQNRLEFRTSEACTPAKSTLALL